MKLKISGEWTEKINCENAHRKYAIRVSNGTYPLVFMLLLFSSCDVAADIVWIKVAPLNFYHIINVQTCTVLKYMY